jgi:hypothetical protein
MAQMDSLEGQTDAHSRLLDQFHLVGGGFRGIRITDVEGIGESLHFVIEFTRHLLGLMLAKMSHAAAGVG